MDRTSEILDIIPRNGYSRVTTIYNEIAENHPMLTLRSKTEAQVQRKLSKFIEKHEK